MITGSVIGPNLNVMGLNIGGFTTYAMASLNTGYCARWKALSTGDIKSVRLNWNSVTAPGVVRIRIETVDATTGLPSGTLYDANATYDVTPAAGVHTYTFATLPTTGLTVNNYYAVVLLTTTAGTTQTLEAYPPPNGLSAVYPVNVLTAADGTTRTNFAVVGAAVPMVSLVLEDDTEPENGFCIFGTRTSSLNMYGTRSAGALFTINAPISLEGYFVPVVITGTPADDLRCRVIDMNNNTITGTDVTVDKDFITQSRRHEFRLPASVKLKAGTYRAVLDSSGSAVGNNYTFRYMTLWNTSATIPNFRYTSSTDGTTWTDVSNSAGAPYLMVNDIVSPIKSNFRGGFING